MVKRTFPSWLVLLVACVGQFMVVLDVSVVNVALPAIHRSLGFSESGLQWIIDIYALAFGGFLLLGGRAADLFGRKKTFVTGLGVFTGASLLGGLATSQTMLLVARTVQGLGGAILAPATLTIITTTFVDPASRTRALAAWAAVASAGGAAGVVLGGVLTDLLSWRWILFINIPIGAAAIATAVVVLEEMRRTEVRHRLDIAGAVTVTLGLFTLVFAIVRTDTYSWGAWQTLMPLALAAGLLVVFVYIEARVASAPLVVLGLFRSRSLTWANLVMLLVGCAIFGMWFFESLYMQDIMGYSPLKAGIAFLPQPLVLAAGAIACSRLVGRVGPRPLLVAGPAISAAGLFWLSHVSSPGGYYPVVLFGGMVAAAGIGLSFTPAAVAATAGVAPEEAGLASGLINASRQIGGSIGLAVMATVATDATSSSLAHLGPSARLNATVQLAALNHGFSRAFIVGAILALGAAVAGTFIPRLPAAGRPAQVERGGSIEEVVEAAPALD